MKAIYESDYSRIESKYTAPWYFAHRVDLHSSLKELALGEAGVGRPARLQIRAKVVSIVSACRFEKKLIIFSSLSYGVP